MRLKSKQFAKINILITIYGFQPPSILRMDNRLHKAFLLKSSPPYLSRNMSYPVISGNVTFV